MELSIVPLNPRPFHDEWFGSWLTRIAHANTMSLSSLLSYIRNDHSSIDFDVKNLLKLAEIFHIDTATLVTTLSTALPLCDIYNRHRIDNVLAMHKNIKLCPICLLIDDVPYLRRKWMSRREESCEKHDVRLVEHCPKCEKLLIPIGEFKSFDYTVLAWDHPACFCQTCGFDLRLASAEPHRYVHIEYIEHVQLTSIQRERWLNALYLMVENYRLDLWLHPTTFTILKTPRSTPARHPDKMRNISIFFQEVVRGLCTSESGRIDVQQLRRFGEGCENLAQSSSIMRNSLKSIRWIASLIEHSKVDYLSLILPSVIFAITLTSSKLESRPWILISDDIWSEIKLDMRMNGYIPARYDRRRLEKIYNTMTIHIMGRLEEYRENTQNIMKSGMFTSFISAVYYIHQSHPDNYEMEKTWLNSTNIEYVRLNNWKIFQESMTYYARDFQSPDVQQNQDSSHYEDLLNLALSMHMTGPNNIRDFLQLTKHYLN